MFKTLSKPAALFVMTALSAALSHANAQASTALTVCATEGQHCTFTGTQTVYFGANGKFASAAKTNGTDCNLAAFGADPAPGVAKACYVPATVSAQPAPLNHERLQNATYVIMPPVIQGNTKLINADQLKEVMAAMSRDSINALKRRFPAAQFTQDVNAANVIRVSPVMVAPTSLTPWASLQGQLTIQDSVTGQQLVSKSSFGLLAVYNHRADAANFVLDQLVQQLP